MLTTTIERAWDEHSSNAVMEGLKNFNSGFIGIVGYRVFASLDDYPTGHTRFMMKKALA
jgi:hypothetical protein